MFRFGPQYEQAGDVSDALPQRATPVGERCLWCDLPVAEGDAGVIVPYLAHDDRSRLVPLHRECYIRQVMGSVGHQRRECPCYGGNIEDPLGMSKREAAVAAWEYWARGRRA